MSDDKRITELEKRSERLLNEMERAAGTPAFRTLKEEIGRVLAEAAELKGTKS